MAQQPRRLRVPIQAVQVVAPPPQAPRGRLTVPLDQVQVVTATPLPAAATAGMLPPSTMAGDPPPPSLIDRAGDVLERAAHTAEDVVLGGILRSGVGGTAYNAARLVSMAMPEHRLPERPDLFAPRNTAERVGQGIENMAEFFAPAGAVRKVAGMAARFGPKAATAARLAGESISAGTVATLQGGNPIAAATFAGIGPAVQGAIGKATPALRKAATEHVMQALGPTKERFKAMAARITPHILRRGLSGNREHILARATQAADEAGAQIDTAIAAYARRQVTTAPVIEALETAKDAFRTRAGATMVVFEPRAVQQLDRLQATIRQLGDNATVDQLVAIRRAWDKVVDQAGGYTHRAGGGIGVPLKDQSEAWAKREATSAIRTLLNQEVPELGALNQEFAFWKTLKDILTQTLQRTQPHQGGIINEAAEVAGQIVGGIGGSPAGPAGAVTGAIVVGKVAKAAQALFTSPRYRFLSARMKNDLADAIASGNIERITGQVSRLSAALGSRLPLPAEARP